jgi:hypothetical protein
MCQPDGDVVVGWTVIPSDGSSGVRVEGGAYWLVVGQYRPNYLAPDVISMTDMKLFVPKDGRPPKRCESFPH